MKMKYLTLVVSIALIAIIASCKKTITLSQSDLLGKWSEVSPCMFPSQCYSIEFADNNQVYDYSPFQDTSHFLLKGGNQIQLSDTVCCGNGSSSVRVLDIIPNSAEDIAIRKFRPFAQFNPGDVPFKDVHLIKIHQ